MTLANTQGTRWQKLLQHEHEQRLYLEDMVEQLGKQHSNLEKQIRKSLNGNGQPVEEAGGKEPLSCVCSALLLSKLEKK